LPRNRGKLISIEGIDQSGKKTQTRLLAERLRLEGYPATIMSFPDYKTPVGRLLNAYLAGTKQFDHHAVHLLYAANKYERASDIKAKIQRGHYVIINRYTPSNLAYGMAHGLPLEWLITLEIGLPKSDAVFLLDVSPKISFGRKELGRDVHEGNVKYLTAVRRDYLRLARMYRWIVLDGEGDALAVSADIWKHVSKIQLRKARGK
jgi:dTMP kinase